MVKIQAGLLVASTMMLLFVVYKVKKNRMNIHYSIIWIIWGALLITLSLFPRLLNWVSDLLSIATPTNALFLIMIFLLYCLMFYVYLKISKHNEEIIDLNYELAKLKNKIENIEKNGKKGS